MRVLTAPRRGRLIGRAQRVIHKSSGGLRYAGRPSPHHRQLQENESFGEKLSAGSSTFLSGRSGAGVGADSRTVTCGGPDASGWFGCIAYTSWGLTITRHIRFWSGGSYALGWSSTLTDSVQQHVRGERCDAHVRVYRVRHGHGAHLRDAAQREGHIRWLIDGRAAGGCAHVQPGSHDGRGVELSLGIRVARNSRTNKW